MKLTPSLEKRPDCANCAAVRDLQACVTWMFLRLDAADQLTFEDLLDEADFAAAIAARARVVPFGGLDGGAESSAAKRSA